MPLVTKGQKVDQRISGRDLDPAMITTPTPNRYRGRWVLAGGASGAALVLALGGCAGGGGGSEAPISVAAETAGATIDADSTGTTANSEAVLGPDSTAVYLVRCDDNVPATLSVYSTDQEGVGVVQVGCAVADEEPGKDYGPKVELLGQNPDMSALGAVIIHFNESDVDGLPGGRVNPSSGVTDGTAVSFLHFVGVVEAIEFSVNPNNPPGLVNVGQVEIPGAVVVQEAVDWQSVIDWSN